MIEFNCVFAKDALTVRKFLRTVKGDDIINYMEITNKLTKNDIYSEEPSDMVVNSYIVKHLEKSMLEKENKKFYFVLSEMDITIIKNLQDHIDSLCALCDESATYNLHIKEKENYKNIHRLFEKVSEIVLK